MLAALVREFSRKALESGCTFLTRFYLDPATGAPQIHNHQGGGT